MPDSQPLEEQAAEYVLGQLEGPAKLEFEARLASSPALRAAVQELECACEALALAAPHMRPSKRVWQRIAQRTASPSPVAAASALRSWRDWLRFAWRSGWAVAIVLVIAWVLSDAFDPRRDWMDSRADNASRRAAQSSGNPTPDEGSSSRTIVTRGPSSNSGPAAPGISNGGAVTSTVPTPASEDSPRLRAWIQQLAGEVADLNRRLTRQATFPAGSGRYQLFRLAATNMPLGVGVPVAANNRPVGTQERVLEQILAGALARQLVVLQEAPAAETPTAGDDSVLSPPPPAASDTVTNLAAVPVESATSAFQVVELAAASSGFDARPIGIGDNTDRSNAVDPLATPTGATTGLGFYSAETGRGTIALVIGQTVPSNQILQFWALDGDKGSTLSLGTTSPSDSPMLIQFAMDPNLFINPAFFVTLEPRGGSSIPTGPVVVRPPDP